MGYQQCSKHMASMQAQNTRFLQIRGAGSKSGTMEKAKIEAQAARSLAETSYQDQRFSLPPGFLSGPTGSKGGAALPWSCCTDIERYCPSILSRI